MSETLEVCIGTLVKNTTRVIREGLNFITKTTFFGKEIAIESTTKLQDMDTKEVLILRLVPEISYDGRDYYKIQA